MGTATAASRNTSGNRPGAILLAAVVVWSGAWSAANDEAGPAVGTIEINAGELSVLFRDNTQSPAVLSGIDSLFNVKHAPGYDAYDPEGKGSSAGLNYEHIISGHESPHNKFTPRQGTYTLHQVNDRTVRLVRRAEDEPWNVASTLTYSIVDPHYIDFDFRCSPQEAALFGERGWATFFFANYMNEVDDVPLQFRGIAAPGQGESWIAGDAPAGHPDWNRGGTYRHVHAASLTCDDDVTFRLNTWSYDWPRFTQPFYYGRAANDMTLILMFDRTCTEVDEMRFSLFKFKVDEQRKRPAWDFQYVIHRVELGQEYGFRGRLVWKKFVSPDDCVLEYEDWVRGKR
ncbi:MAG: hypothetical protein KF861_07420 [Planctomycetaceae bacterium]|nr:hypothetical protein [Planctomycetaceae bacterium]